jgi:gas vesicle protein
MKQEEGGFNAGSVLLSFFIGGLVGAGVALLMAPRAGEETREKIKGLAVNLRGKAEDVIEDVKSKAEGYIEEVKTKATSAVEKGKELLEEKKSIISTAIEAGKEAYEKEKEKLLKESS